MDFFTQALQQHHVEFLKKAKLGLEHLWVIDCANYNWPVAESNATKLLLKLGFIKVVDDDADSNKLTCQFDLTLGGHQFLRELLSLQPTKEKVKKSKKSTALVGTFDAFWDNYPKSSFIYKGKVFTSDRALKANRQMCAILYARILAEGRLTAAQIDKALATEVELKKRKSFETGINQLQYMKGMEPYLRHQAFMDFIDLALPEEKETLSNVMDI